METNEGEEQKENVMISNREGAMVAMILEEEKQEEFEEEEYEEEKRERRNEHHQEEEEDEEDEAVLVLTPPKRDTPYVVIQYDKTWIFYSIPEKTKFVQSLPAEIWGTLCMACCHGWLVMYYHNSNKKSLFNPITMEIIHLPPLKVPKYSTRCVLSSSPPSCVVMFLIDDEACCKFCWLRDRKWIKMDLGIPRRFAEWPIEAAVSCQGRIYVPYCYSIGKRRSEEGIAIFDFKSHQIVGNGDMESNPAIESLSTCNVSGSSPFTLEKNEYVYTRRNMRDTFTVEKIRFESNKEVSRYYRLGSSSKVVFLVETCGEVYMLLKIWEDPHDVRAWLHDIKIFKLNLNTRYWEDVHTLGEDRAFFLYSRSAVSGCAVSLPASILGLEENYLYFTMERDAYINTCNVKNRRYSACCYIPAMKTTFYFGYVMPSVEIKREREVVGMGRAREVVEQAVSYTLEQLVAVNPYNPDILPDLESYVNEQVSSETYSLDANLCLLRLYKLEPERMSTQIVACILVKALMAMPAPDFSLCLDLIPEQVQMEEQFQTLIVLSHYLETARFQTARLRQFWDEAAKNRSILDVVPGFEDAVRNYAIHILSLTYQKVPWNDLAEAININGPSLDKFLEHQVANSGWVVEKDQGRGQLIVLPRSEFNQDHITRIFPILR